MDIIEGLTPEEYDNIDALNISRLSRMAESPGHYKLPYKASSNAMRVGTAIHMAFLEPDRFKEIYCVEPEMIYVSIRDEKGKKTADKAMQPVNKRMPEHRDIIEEWRREKEALGALVMTPSELDDLTGMLNSLASELKLRREGVNLADLLHPNGKRELTVVRDIFGRKCKGRADILVDTKYGRTVVDLKKVGKSAHPKAFSYDVTKFHYEAKAWWYTKLFDADAFIWVAVEEKSPHAIGVYNAQHFMEIGEKKVNKWLTDLARCEHDGDFPWYTRGTDDIWPTDFAIKQNGEF